MKICTVKMYQNKKTSTIIIKNETNECIQSDMTLEEVAETLAQTSDLSSIRYELYDNRGSLINHRNILLNKLPVEA